MKIKMLLSSTVYRINKHLYNFFSTCCTKRCHKGLPTLTSIPDHAKKIIEARLMEQLGDTLKLAEKTKKKCMFLRSKNAFNKVQTTEVWNSLNRTAEDNMPTKITNTKIHNDESIEIQNLL